MKSGVLGVVVVVTVVVENVVDVVVFPIIVVVSAGAVLFGDVVAIEVEVDAVVVHALHNAGHNFRKVPELPPHVEMYTS